MAGDRAAVPRERSAHAALRLSRFFEQEVATSRCIELLRLCESALSTEPRPWPKDGSLAAHVANAKVERVRCGALLAACGLPQDADAAMAAHPNPLLALVTYVLARVPDFLRPPSQRLGGAATALQDAALSRYFAARSGRRTGAFWPRGS